MSRRFEQIYQKNEGKEHSFSKKRPFPFGFSDFYVFGNPFGGKLRETVAPFPT
jgi:hypothetical protein